MMFFACVFRWICVVVFFGHERLWVIGEFGCFFGYMIIWVFFSSHGMSNHRIFKGKICVGTCWSYTWNLCFLPPKNICIIKERIGWGFLVNHKKEGFIFQGPHENHGEPASCNHSWVVATQRVFMFTPIWGRFPFWPIFFKGGETTN